MDDNVHPNVTQLVIDELVEHKKDVDLIVFPTRDHGYSGEPYPLRRTWHFVVRPLRDRDPSLEYETEREGEVRTILSGV